MAEQEKQHNDPAGTALRFVTAELYEAADAACDAADLAAWFVGEQARIRTRGVKDFFAQAYRAAAADNAATVRAAAQTARNADQARLTSPEAGLTADQLHVAEAREAADIARDTATVLVAVVDAINGAIDK